MESTQPFLPLLLISVLAFLVPVLASRVRIVRIPIVVGEILAGMLVGRSGLDLMPASPEVEFLALFGFTYLMFLSGLEVDFDLLALRGPQVLRHPLREPAAVGVVLFLGTLLLTLIVGFILHAAGLTQQPLLMALILSTTSVGIVVPTLKERGLTQTRLGQMMLAAAVIADFATMLLITVFASISQHGVSAQLLLLFGLFVAFFAAYRLGLALQRRATIRRLFDDLGQATAQLGVRASFALILAFIALAQGLGAEIILGAFLAGAMVSLLAGHGSQDLRLKLDAIGFGFFVPVFFIHVGVGFDLPVLLSSPRGLLLVPGLLLAAYTVKLLPALVFRAHCSWRETLAAGILLSSRLSLIIAAAAIGLRLGLISEAVNSAIILVAILSSISAPLLFNRVLPAVRAPRRPVVVVGGTELARDLAQGLAGRGLAVALIDGHDAWSPDDERVCLVPMRGELPDQLRQADANAETILVAASGVPMQNLRYARLAAAAFGVQRCLVVADTKAAARRVRRLGFEPVSVETSLLDTLSNLVQRPTTFQAVAGAGPVALDEVAVDNPALAGQALHALRLPGRCLIALMRRGDELFVPHGETRLQVGDRAVLVGDADAVRESQALLSLGAAGQDSQRVTTRTG
jgi:CPA2 family monovalent cation:H+ antiporter-2